MPKSCIIGYDAEIERERTLRVSAFLGIPYDICGIKINNITPFLMARLQIARTPFLCADVAYSDAETIKFLWALSPDFSIDPEKREAFIFETTKRLAMMENGWDRAEREIEQFVRETFMDAPHAGIESVPYVSGIAWLVYAFSKDPMRWDKERTIHTPYRELYQYTRCMKMERGDPLRNEFSDVLREKFLDEVNANLRAGGRN